MYSTSFGRLKMFYFGRRLLCSLGWPELCQIDQAALNLQQPCLWLLNAGIIYVHHHAWHRRCILKKCLDRDYLSHLEQCLNQSRYSVPHYLGRPECSAGEGTLATQPGDLSSMHQTRTVEGEKWFLQLVLWRPHCSTCAHTNKHTQNKHTNFYKNYLPVRDCCHANAEQSKAKLFPLPVGLSNKQCCPLFSPLTICGQRNQF